MKNRILLISEWLVLVLILGFAINSIVSTYLKKFIIHLANERNEISLEDFHINIFLGNVNITNLQFESKDKSTQLFVPELKISGINIPDALLNNEFRASKINADGMTLLVDHSDTSKSTSPDVDTNSTSGPKAKVFVSEININNSDLRLNGIHSDWSVPKANFTFYNVKTGSDSVPVIAENGECELQNVKCLMNDSLYTFKINSIKLNSNDQSILIKEVELSPNYDEKEFSQKFGEQVDRFKIRVNNLRAGGFDWMKLVEDKSIIAQSLRIDSVQVEAYRDKYFERNNTRRKRMREVIDSYPGTIDIEECSIQNSQVTYGELTPPSNKPGWITINKINTEISNLSNLDQDTIRMQSKCLLNGFSPMEVNIQFPPNPSVFHLKGRVDKIPMENLNSILEQGAPFTIRSGHIDSLLFGINSTKQKMNGTILLRYDNFKITIIDRETRDSSGFARKVLSDFANAFIIQSGNHKDKPDTNFVEREYREDRFIIYNILQTLVNGVVGTVK